MIAPLPRARARIRSCTWALIVGALACGPAEEEPRRYGTIEDTTLAPDSVEIVYTVRGHGAVAVVFVHCWACDMTFWSEQLDQFAGEYRVVALDLGGHGRSGSAREDWSLATLAGDVVAVLDDLDLERVILVGHSLGGPVSLEVARRAPGRVIGVACVESLHDLEIDYRRSDVEAAVRSLETDFAGTMDRFVRSAFPEDADTALVERISARARAADREAVIGIARSLPGLDLAAIMSDVDVPVRCINAAARPPSVPPTRVETNRRYGDFDAAIMQDVGHFLMLERPDAFNRQLRRVLNDITDAGAGPSA